MPNRERRVINFRRAIDELVLVPGDELVVMVRRRAETQLQQLFSATLERSIAIDRVVASEFGPPHLVYELHRGILLIAGDSAAPVPPLPPLLEE